MTYTKFGTISNMDKITWSIAGAVTAAVGSPLPSAVRELIWVVLCFTLLDTLLGVYVAWRFRQVESRKFIEKLTDKAVLFIVIGIAAFAVASVLDSWLICKGAAISLIAYEFASILESFKRLAGKEKNGKILVQIIEKLSKGFVDKGGVTVQQTDTQTQQTTVTMTPNTQGKP